MALLRDVSEVGNINLASEIAQTFSKVEIDKVQEGLGILFEALPADNLTLWSKENDQLQYTCQALAFSAMANGLDYAVKYQQKQIDKIADDLAEHFKSNQGTEFWNVKAESLLERLAVCEHNLDALAQVFDVVKHNYKNSTGDSWKPYTPPSKTTAETATAYEVQATLARLKRVA
jgi:hypothetical protein